MHLLHQKSLIKVTASSLLPQILYIIALYLTVHPQTIYISQPSPQTQFSKLSKDNKVRVESILCEDNKARVESILYLIDNFGVGNEFVHELSMTIEGLPKSYLFEQCRTELNKNCIIKSTTGKALRAQHSCRQLLSDQVQQIVCTYLVCSFFCSVSLCAKITITQNNFE